MDFIIGGSHQGKWNFVKENYTFTKVFYGAQMTEQELKDKEVLKDLHLFIYRQLQQGVSPQKIDSMLEQLFVKVVVTDEIGYGIVPIDPMERNYREITGRICCKIASRSEHVYRILCGIPTQLK